MDFYQHQDKARSRTTQLVLLYAGAVLGMGAAVGILVHVLFLPPAGAPVPADQWLFVFGSVAALWTIILLGSLYKTAQLSQGGSKVAETLGGRLIPTSTTDPLERRCLNVVEEMAIASGMPVPATYLLDAESAINAFAAGWSHDDAVIGITRGALEQLDREQLQGVIAHEFSHILNRDCALNMRLLGVLHGILLLTIIGRILIRLGSGSRRSRKGGLVQLVVVGGAIWLLGAFGGWMARLIQAAVSRQREFLADASAVQFTRNPRGLAGALATIGAGSSRLESPRAEEASHMMLGRPGSKSWFGLTATHPPLEERITRIFPSWTGEFATMVASRSAILQAAEQELSLSPQQRTVGLSSLSGLSAAGTAHAARSLDLDKLAAHPSWIPGPDREPSSLPAQAASRIVTQLDPSWRVAAESPFSARGLILAWIIDADPEQLTAHAAALSGDEALAAETNRLGRALRHLEGASRLPLFDIALGTLAQLSDSQRAHLHERLATLLLQLSPRAYRAYCLAALAVRRLGQSHRESRPLLIKEAIEVVLGVLAHQGHDDPSAARAAFDAGRNSWGKRGESLQLIADQELTVRRLDRAVGTLLRLPTSTREKVLRSAQVVAAHDGILRPAEAELLRTMSTCLGVGHWPD